MTAYDRLKAIVVRDLGKQEALFSWDADYKNDLGFDSMELVLLVCQIESAFGIAVDDGEIHEIMTVSATLDLIERHTAKAAEEVPGHGLRN